jgi:hypothetical protein
MAKATTNEGRCCDAVLRILEAERGMQRREVKRDTSASRGIDVTCYIGAQHYALEHTLIEPFPENRRDDIAFGRVFDPAFEAELADLLQPGLAYRITVNVYAFSDFNRQRLLEARAKLLAWARATVPRVPIPPRRGPTETRIHAEPPEVPVCVTVACHHSPRLGAQLLPSRYAPPDLEKLRRTRLRKTLEEKGPKLDAARIKGSRTILIVENHDFSLTSEGTLSEFFDQLCAEVRHPPTDIYVVDTRENKNTFRVTQVRRAGLPCLLMGRKQGDWEYTGNGLNDI